MAEAIVSCSRCQTRYEAEASSISTLTPLCPACVESGSAETRALSLGAPQLDDDELTPVLDTASCTGLEGRAGATSRFQLWSSRPRRTSWLAAGASLIAVAAAVGIVAFLGMTGPRDSHPEDASATAVSLSGSKGKAASPLVAEWKRQHREWQAAKGKPEAAAAEMTKQVEATSRQILAEEPDVVEVPAAMLEHFAATRQHADVARAAEILVAHDPRQSEARKLGVAAYIELKQYDQADKLRRAGLTGDMALPRVELSTQRGKIVLELLEDEAPDLVAILVQRIEQGMFVNEVIREASPHWVGCSHPFDQGAVPPQFQLLPRTNAEVPTAGDIHMIPWFKGFTIFRPGNLPYFKPLFRVARVVEGMETVSILEKGDKFTAKILNKRPHAYEPKFIRDDSHVAAAKATTSLTEKAIPIPLARENAPRVEISTNRGKFVLELLDEEAPGLVALFLYQIEQRMYENEKFDLFTGPNSTNQLVFYQRLHFPHWDPAKHQHPTANPRSESSRLPGEVHLICPEVGTGFAIERDTRLYDDTRLRVAWVVEGTEVVSSLQRGDQFSIKILKRPVKRQRPNVRDAIERAKADEATEVAEREEAERLNREVSEKEPLPQVEITTQSGKLFLELFEDEAPEAVAAFIHLVEQDFYDDFPFQLVVPGLLVQGGDPNGTGASGADKRLPIEAKERKHWRGSIGMQPDRAGTQLYF